MATDKLEAADAAVSKILRKCSEDPAYWMFSWVRTRDEHDSRNPRKPFPDKAYLRWILNEIHNTDEQVIYIAKSRQLMVSWLICAYALWKALFRSDTLILLQSKKQEDAAPLIYEKSVQHGRISLMLSELPKWMQVCQLADRSFMPLAELDRLFSYASMALPNGSQILGLAQGSSQVEGRVPTLFLSDEASLQDEWESAMAAAKPAIEGDAKIVAVGTMRMPSAFGMAIAPSHDVDPDMCGRGLARFKSPEGVYGIRVHYSADPDKDPQTDVGAAWLRGQVESGAYPGGKDGWRFQQHMEINPVARSGTPCIPIYREAEHIFTIPNLRPEQTFGWSFDAGLDWGVLNLAVLLTFGMRPDGRRFLLHEIALPGGEIGGIPGFCRLIQESPWFKSINGIIWGDPTLWNKDQNTTGGLTSKAHLFMDNGVHILPAKANGQDADEIALDRLNNYYWDDPTDPLLYICEGCHVTRKTFPALMYEEWSEAVMYEKSPKERMKGKDVDCWDCFDDQTEILTKAGWKPFRDLGKTDEVATWDNGSLSYERPKRIVEYNYIGPMYLYESHSLNFCVTPNHNHFVANQMSTIREKSPRFKRRPVSDLPEVCWVPRTASWEGRIIESPIPSIPLDHLLAFVGFWLAEGCRDRHYMIVDQKDPDQEIWEMIEALGVPFRYQENKKRHGRFRLNSRAIAELIPHGLAHEKRIPRWVLDLPIAQILIVLKWMFKGDASLDMMRYNTVSEGLANDVQEALIKVGLCSSITKIDGQMSRVEPSGWEGMTRDVYHVQVQGGRYGQGGAGSRSLLSQIRRRDMKQVAYSGKVHCVETESGVIYVRRNGRPMWSGNSFKYAEVAWPDVPKFVPQVRPGSFQWYKNRTAPRNAPRKRGDLY